MVWISHSLFIYSAIEGHWFLPGWGDYKAAINIPNADYCVETGFQIS